MVKILHQLFPQQPGVTPEIKAKIATGVSV